MGCKWRLNHNKINKYIIEEVSLGGKGKRKDRETWKSKSEEKVVGFSSGSLFTARKCEAVTQGENKGDRPSIEEDNLGSWYHQRLRKSNCKRITDTFM